MKCEIYGGGKQSDGTQDEGSVPRGLQFVLVTLYELNIIMLCGSHHG